MSALDPKNQTVKQEASEPRQEYNKGVHNALNQRQCDHATIRCMADLMAQNRVDLATAHVVQKAGADRDQGSIAVPACGVNWWYAVGGLNKMPPARISNSQTRRDVDT